MKITVLAGGISTERDVSLVSGMGVYRALKENGHNAVLIDLYLGLNDVPADINDIFNDERDWAKAIKSVAEAAPDINAVKASRPGNPEVMFVPNVLQICSASDIVFMALHGDCGENGKIQATFDLLGIRYTGTDYISSALSMDKAITKSIFVQTNVRTP